MVILAKTLPGEIIQVDTDSIDTISTSLNQHEGKIAIKIQNAIKNKGDLL